MVLAISEIDWVVIKAMKVNSFKEEINVILMELVEIKDLLLEINLANLILVQVTYFWIVFKEEVVLVDVRLHQVMYIELDVLIIRWYLKIKVVIDGIVTVVVIKDSKDLFVNVRLKVHYLIVTVVKVMNCGNEVV